MAVQAVVFDVGGTLIDETRYWQGWADWLDVPRAEFFAVLGAVIERGEHHRRAFELVRPRLDIEAARREREAAGDSAGFIADDFYPDVRTCLEELRTRGLRIGIVGNHSERVETMLRSAHVPADFIASSASWKVEKPAPEFFERVADAAGVPPGTIAYVGDRLDNDVLPAIRAGMIGVFIGRGLWGAIHRTRAEAAQAHAQLTSLRELPDVLARV